MKKMLIILNVILVSLMLYNFYFKIKVFVEPLKGCKKDKSDLVYKQEAKINKLENTHIELRRKLDTLKALSNSNLNKINKNEKSIKGSVQDINNEKNKKMKELENL